MADSDALRYAREVMRRPMWTAYAGGKSWGPMPPAKSWHETGVAVDLVMPEGRALDWMRSSIGRMFAGLTSEETMMRETTTMFAPDNPYRRPERDDLSRSSLFTQGLATTSRPEESGPGLLAADIDHIARTNHRAGYQRGRADAQREIDQLRNRLADAFDEGYMAGRVQRARGLAHDFRGRLIGVKEALRAVEAGPKAKARDALSTVHTAIDDVSEFALGIMGSGERAAAQMARDEG